jgi:hypothetical protein
MSQLIKFEEQQNKIKTFEKLAQIAVSSGCYGNMSIAQAMNIMFSAFDLGISPHKALNKGLVIIKGAVTMSANLISDRIRRSGHSIKVVEYSREKCVCIGVRKDNGDSFKSEYDWEDAKLAGLTSKDNWRNYPKDMLYSRAVSRLGRVLFADVVGACYSEDERDDISGSEVEGRRCRDPDAIEIESESIIQKEPSISANEPLESLEEHLKSDGISAHALQQYISELASKKKENPDLIIQSALLPELLPKFKVAYQKFLSRIQLPVPDEAVPA